MGELTYCAVTDYDQLTNLASLQGTAWPAEMFTSAVHLKAAVLHGGAVIAAYDGAQPVGFCYGFPAFNGTHSYLHSHMMVVNPAYRNRGLGTKLKLEQRQWALAYGYGIITWTYDPFQPRNAYLNLCKLGGTISTYIPAMYGTDVQSDPSDRFLVRWELASHRVTSAIQGGHGGGESRWHNYRVLLGNVEQGMEQQGQPEQSEHQVHREHQVKAWSEVNGESGYLLAVPQDSAAVKQRNPEALVQWKRRLRELCKHAFRNGYRIVGFLPGSEDVGYYVLEGVASE